MFPVFVEAYHVQAYLKDIVGLVPDHHNKTNIAVKQIVIFLLVEGLAFNW